jgi:hypothetical protein
MKPYCLGLILFFAALLRADDDIQSLSVFNGNLNLSPTLTLQIHSRVRTNNDLSQFFQVRTGPIVFWQWKPRVQWIGGYYFLNQHYPDDFYHANHRVFGGAQFRLINRGTTALDWRKLLERHIDTLPSDFTRVRSRMTLSRLPKQGWQPFGMTEGLALRGKVIGRFGTGLNYATEGGHLFGFGYEYRMELGRNAHVITTMMQFGVNAPKNWLSR